MKNKPTLTELNRSTKTYRNRPIIIANTNGYTSQPQICKLDKTAYETDILNYPTLRILEWMKIKWHTYLYYRQKLSNIPEKSLNVTIEKVYELTITNSNIIMTSQTSSLNIAIKNGKQPNNSITVEDRRTYKKIGKTSKAVTFTLKHGK